jgi:hypothetical protein
MRLHYKSLWLAGKNANGPEVKRVQPGGGAGRYSTPKPR